MRRNNRWLPMWLLTGIILFPAGSIVFSQQLSESVADSLFRSGEYIASRNIWIQLQAQQPGSHNHWYNLGLCDLALGENRLAYREFRRAARMLKSSADYAYRAGYAAWLTGHAHSAERWLKRSIALDSRNDRAWAVRARVWHKKNKPQKAIECARKATETDALSADNWALLGDVLHASGQHREAADIYRIALAADPGNATLMTGKARCEFEMNDLSSALMDIQAAVEIDSAHTEAGKLRAELLLAKVEQSGETEARILRAAAWEQASRCLAQAPERADLWKLRGITNVQLENYSSAELDFKNALKKELHHSETWFWLSVVKSGQGNSAEAIEMAKKSCREHPVYVESQLQLGVLLKESGYWAPANRWLRRASRSRNTDIRKRAIGELEETYWKEKHGQP